MPILIHALSEGDQEGREAAIQTIRKLRSEADEAIPVLTTLVDGEDENFALKAAMTLGAMGPRATGSVPGIRRLIDRPTSRSVKEWSVISS